MRFLHSTHRLERFASAWSRGFSLPVLFFGTLIGSMPLFAEPAPLISGRQASGPVDFSTISQLGESDQQAATRTGSLLSRRRTTDPFGITIRGPYKGLPPVVAHPTATPVTGQTSGGNPAPEVNLSTLEKAIQELSIGAVNAEARELLIKSRVIREGDLLVLESGGRQFVVWVQSVNARGVLFCDIDLKKQFMKTFGSAPTELPGDAAVGLPDIDSLFNNGTKQ